MNDMEKNQVSESDSVFGCKITTFFSNEKEKT